MQKLRTGGSSDCFARLVRTQTPKPRRRATSFVRGVPSSTRLRAAILAYVEVHNERRTPFTWVKTADESLDKMRRFGLRAQQVYGH